MATSVKFVEFEQTRSNGKVSINPEKVKAFAAVNANVTNITIMGKVQFEVAASYDAVASAFGTRKAPKSSAKK